METKIRKKEMSFNEMNLCRISQWNSGKRKDEYCKNCPEKEKCFKFPGR